MIMFTITKPKRKLKKLFSAAALILLLGVVVPGIYFTLSGVGAMSLFASGEAIGEDAAGQPTEQAAPSEQTEPSEQTAAEPAEPTEPTDQTEPTEPTAAEQAETEPTETTEPAEQAEAEKAGFLQSLRAVFFGEQLEVIPY